MKRLLSKLDRWLLLSLLLTTAVVTIGSSNARPYDVLGVLVLGPVVAVVRRGPLAGVLVGLYALVLVIVFGSRDPVLLTAHLDDIVALTVGTVVIGWMAHA